MKSGASLGPTSLRDFLKASGWTVIEEALQDRLYAFRNPQFTRRNLVFPMDSDAPDYAEAVDIALAKLAEMTGLAPEKLFARVQSSGDDVVRMRIYSYGDDNALPLSFAASLVQNAAKVLKSAACTVVRPRVHHPKLSLSDANALVDNARFGHTEEGSFILRVACPIHAVQGTLGSEDGPVPFVRRVTLSMQRALALLMSAIETDRLEGMVDELKTSPNPLLSANLCEAIAGMHDEALGNSLEVSVDWSALYPVHDSALWRPVRIQRDYFARIEEVYQELRSVTQAAEGQFFGTVEALNGTMDEADGRRSGEVILSLLLPEEGEVIRVKVVLSTDDYSKADRAHMTNKAVVRISGRLLPGRQPRWLTDASDFTIVSPQSL